jgi:WhiB family redox-sensing transcriptional regulator
VTGYGSKGLMKAEQGLWVDHGACVGTDPELFFPDRGNQIEKVAQAKAICAGCTVRTECLSYALSMGRSLLGIWGGLTDHERARYTRAQRRERHVTG